MCRNEAEIHENSASELNKKRCLKTDMGPEKWHYFGENSSWGAFGGPNRFCDEQVGPPRPQSAPKNEKWANMTEK